MKFIRDTAAEGLVNIEFTGPASIELTISNFGEAPSSIQLQLSDLDSLINELLKYKRAILEELLQEENKCSINKSKKASKSKKKEKKA